MRYAQFISIFFVCIYRVAVEGEGTRYYLDKQDAYQNPGFDTLGISVESFIEPNEKDLDTVMTERGLKGADVKVCDEKSEREGYCTIPGHSPSHETPETDQRVIWVAREIHFDPNIIPRGIVAYMPRITSLQVSLSGHIMSTKLKPFPILNE